MSAQASNSSYSMRMKCYVALIPSCISLAVCASGLGDRAQTSMNWGLPADGLMLSVSTQKEVFEVGEPISVGMHITNCSSQRIEIYGRSEGAPGQTAHGEFRIVGPGRQLVGRRWFPGWSGPTSRHGGQHEIRGFQHWEWFETITRSFYLTEPGQYVVYGVFPYNSPALGNKSEVISGNLIIQIVPRKPGSTNAFDDPELDPTTGKPWRPSEPVHVPTPIKGRSYPGIKSGEGAPDGNPVSQSASAQAPGANGGHEPTGPFHIGTILKSRDGRFGLIVFVLLAGAILWLWRRHRQAGTAQKAPPRS